VLARAVHLAGVVCLKFDFAFVKGADPGEHAPTVSHYTLHVKRFFLRPVEKLTVLVPQRRKFARREEEEKAKKKKKKKKKPL
jgi:hypothetical protein